MSALQLVIRQHAVECLVPVVRPGKQLERESSWNPGGISWDVRKYRDFHPGVMGT